MTMDLKKVIQRIDFIKSIEKFQNSVYNVDGLEIGMTKKDLEKLLLKLVIEYRSKDETSFSIKAMADFFDDCFDLDSGSSAKVINDKEFAVGAYILFNATPHEKLTMIGKIMDNEGKGF